MLDARRDKWSFHTQYDYLLNKRLRCACNYSIVSRSNEKKYHFYQCGGRYYGKLDKNACCIPKMKVDWVDALVWTKLEVFMHDPEYELETLRKVQQQQRVTHSEAVMTLEQIEAIRAEYTQYKKEAWLDYKVHRSLKEADYNKIVAELDERLDRAERVYQEYQAKVSAKVLSDKEIKKIGKEMRTLGDYLDRIGHLEFLHKRQVIELLDITGRFEIAGNEVVLWLAIHNVEFDYVAVQDVDSKRGSS